MIFDKELMLAEGMAHDQVGPIIEIGSLTSSIGPGRGEVIPIHVTGIDVAGTSGAITIESSNDGTSFGVEMIVLFGPQTVNDKGIVFGLSSAVSRYIRIRFDEPNYSDLTAGTLTAGIVADFLLG